VSEICTLIFSLLLLQAHETQRASHSESESDSDSESESERERDSKMERLTDRGSMNTSSICIHMAELE
jgi:hypothetical protein